jgi:hypothetical protein
MNRDLMNNANPRRVANATMAVIDATQRGFQPHEQMLAMAAAFLMLAEHWGMPAQDAFRAVTNIMNDQDGKRPEFGAVARYMKEELR